MGDARRSSTPVHFAHSQETFSFLSMSCYKCGRKKNDNEKSELHACTDGLTKVVCVRVGIMAETARFLSPPLRHAPRLGKTSRTRLVAGSGFSVATAISKFFEVRERGRVSTTHYLRPTLKTQVRKQSRLRFRDSLCEKLLLPELVPRFRVSALRAV